MLLLPPGAIALMVFLPCVVFGLYFACNADQCVSLNPLSPVFLKGSFPFAGHSVRSFADKYLLSSEAALLYVGWFALQVVLYFVLPGRVVEGVPIDSRGTRLRYPLNGLASLVVSVGIMVLLAYKGVISPTVAYDLFPQLAFTATVFSYALAVYLYAYSHWTSRDGGRYLDSETQLAPHGHTGNEVYDFFIGRSLNPRIGSLDLKYFCELRPGLILWLLINLSMACAQYERHGSVSSSMVLVLLFQAYYVFDDIHIPDVLTCCSRVSLSASPFDQMLDQILIKMLP
jgi:hypothetical protein